MKRFFYVKDQEKVGPVSIEDLKEAKINKETLIWYEELTDWERAGSLEILQEIFELIPPPLDLSRNAKFNDSKISSHEILDASLKKNHIPIFTKVWSSKGRITRREFGITFVLFYSSIIIFAFLLTSLNLDVSSGDTLLLILLVPIQIFRFIQGAKRCHDRGNSGWFQIIPGYVLWMLFAPGDHGLNKYGANPRGFKEVEGTLVFESVHEKNELKGVKIIFILVSVALISMAGWMAFSNYTPPLVEAIDERMINVNDSKYEQNEDGSVSPELTEEKLWITSKPGISIRLPEGYFLEAQNDEGIIFDIFSPTEKGRILIEVEKKEGNLEGYFKSISHTFLYGEIPKSLEKSFIINREAVLDSSFIDKKWIPSIEYQYSGINDKDSKIYQARVTQLLIKNNLYTITRLSLKEDFDDLFVRFSTFVDDYYIKFDN